MELGCQKLIFYKQLQLIYIIKKIGQNSKNENRQGIEFDFLKLLRLFL